MGVQVNQANVDRLVAQIIAGMDGRFDDGPGDDSMRRLCNMLHTKRAEQTAKPAPHECIIIQFPPRTQPLETP